MSMSNAHILMQPTTPKTPNSTNRQSSFFHAFKSRIRRNKRRSRQSWGSQTIHPCVRQSINSYAAQANDTRSSSYTIIKENEIADLEARYVRYLASESSVAGLVEHLMQYQRAWKDILSASLALHTDLLFFNDRSSTHRCHAEQLLNIMQATNQTINQQPMQRLLTVINACKDMRDEFASTKKRYEVYTTRRIEVEAYKKKVDELRSRNQANAARMTRKETKLRSLTSSFALLYRQLYHALEPFQPSLPSILNVPFCELFDTTNALHSIFADQHRSATQPIIQQLDETPNGDERDLCLILDFDVINENESDDDLLVEANITSIAKPAVRIMYRNPPYDEAIPFVDYHRAFDPQRAFSFDAPHAFNPPPFIATAHIKNFIVTRSVNQSNHADGYHTHSHLYSDKQSVHARSRSVSVLASASQSMFQTSNKPPSLIPPPLPQSINTMIHSTTNQPNLSHHREPVYGPPAPPRPATSPAQRGVPASQPASPALVQPHQMPFLALDMTSTMSPPPIPLRRAPAVNEQQSTHLQSTSSSSISTSTPVRPPPLPVAAPPIVTLSAAIVPLSHAPPSISVMHTSSPVSSHEHLTQPQSIPLTNTPPRKVALSQLSIDTSKLRTDTLTSKAPVVPVTYESVTSPSSIRSAESARSHRAQSPGTSTGTVFIHRLQRSPSLQQHKSVTSSTCPLVFTVTDQRPDTPPRSRVQRTPSSSPLAARLAMFEALTPDAHDISPRRPPTRSQPRDI